MIDIEKEHLCKLVDVPSQIPTKPHLSTVVRWTRQGLNGAILETILIGGRRLTSVQAIQRFIQVRNGKNAEDA